MRLKSYFVHSMDEAIRLAKRELGDEAMLVDSRPSAAPHGGKPRLEVIFAASSVAPPPVIGASAVASAPRAESQTPLRAQVAAKSLPPAQAASASSRPITRNSTAAVLAAFPVLTTEPTPAPVHPAPAVPPLSAPVPAGPPIVTAPSQPGGASRNSSADRPVDAAVPAQRLAGFQADLGALLYTLQQPLDSASVSASSPWKSVVESLYAPLLQRDVPAPLAFDLLDSLYRKLCEKPARFPETPERARADVQSALQTALETALPPIEREAGHPNRTLLFAGPAGAGKTTNIAKLAFQLGVNRGRPVQVLSLDTLRIGAANHLAHLCSLLGVPFRALESPTSLPAALTENSHRDYILIDTPGFTPSDGDILQDLAAVAGKFPGMERHLVLPAWLRYADLLRIKDFYACLQPSHLLFTRLDETELLGPAWALSATSQIPLSWFSTGPNIPDDLEPADASRLAGCLAQQAFYLPPPARPELPPHYPAVRAAAAGHRPA